MPRLGIVYPDPEEESVELSARRTGMSFQRTSHSADRTLMSVIRTSLSLIAFGFTISQFFEHLVHAQVLSAGHESTRRFGGALVALGIVMLVVGIAYHLSFMRGLRHEGIQLADEGLIHDGLRYPVSRTLIGAVVLVVIGAFAIVSIVWHAGPFR